MSDQHCFIQQLKVVDAYPDTEKKRKPRASYHLPKPLVSGNLEHKHIGHKGIKFKVVGSENNPLQSIQIS